jgi:DNA-binding Lrp family transcriptional regulator
VREAFVCINASPGSVETVLTKLNACKEVKQAFRVYGPYDIIARVSGESIEDLSKIIDTRIKRLDEVRTILSMLMIKPLDDFTWKSEPLTVK